ncbi:ImmA/IrrE family metallo-endopeptidase [Cohnella sp. REN36]|uniref:ImmA/IrrE family metallo-endopeptidase n=1 Tax=Cohnella sp. REN36 TaxID=2887347 RepID=UPI001D136024|nr:ImmA/IrrE family metallo-endopeptidase [Cohnella sp. REN36]MCC3375492.1 ImmA/IrrE family metallo-endopeptidase [Cohnella sp. REN36]
MGYIRAEVHLLIQSAGTSDPLEIAAQKNILVLYENLGTNIWGYFTNANRIPMIHVNNKLDEVAARFTIAHELGHYALHPKLNTPFLKHNTLLSVDRIERQANLFAMHLLTIGRMPEADATLASFLSQCGIPEEIHKLYR